MKKSLKFILAVMLIMVLGMSSFSMAASGNARGKVELKPSKSTVKSGESFTVEVAQECSDGIIGFEANLNYDANVFEFEGADMANNWTNLGEGTKLEAMSNNDQKSGNVFVLKFDVKDNISETTSEISVTDVKLYKTAEETISVEDENVSIKVNEVANNGNQEQNPDQTPEEKPTPVTLSSISVSKVPTKTEYKAGEKFDVAGMEITAKYSDGTSKKVTEFTYSPSGELKTTDKKVTISYKDGDITKTVEQTITVKTVQSQEPANNTVNNTVNNTAKNTVSNNTVKNTTKNTVKNNTVNNTAKNTTKVTSATNNTANNTATNATGLPKTGSTATTISFAAIVLIGIAVISYVGYQKYKGI